MAVDDLPAAAASLREAVALQPTFADALCDLGACLRRLRDHRAALAALTAAVKQNPRHVRTALQLSSAAPPRERRSGKCCEPQSIVPVRPWSTSASRRWCCCRCHYFV